MKWYLVEIRPAAAAIQVINRKIRQKITQGIDNLNNLINQIDPIDIPFKRKQDSHQDTSLLSHV